jgi:hypothetical protein
MSDLGASQSPEESKALHSNRNFEVLPDQNYGTWRHLQNIARRLASTVHNAPHPIDNMEAVHGSRRYFVCRYYMLHLHRQVGKKEESGAMS